MTVCGSCDARDGERIRKTSFHVGSPAHAGVNHTERQVLQYTIDLNKKKRIRRRQPDWDEKKRSN